MTDLLSLNSIGFPVRSGTLSRYRDASGVRCWSIKIHCGESPQLNYREWPDDRLEGELDWLAGAEPFFYAQMLPLPADSPEELVGRTFSFPQSPGDEPAAWDRAAGWLFFCLYLFEHDTAYPMEVTFVERQGIRYRVKIVGFFPCNNTNYQLQVETWLDWMEAKNGASQP